MTATEVNDITINASPINNVVKNEKKSATAKLEKLIDEEDEITKEDLAPDGGWGWIIALAMILVIVSTIIHSKLNNSALETNIYFLFINNILKIISKSVPTQT